MLKVRASPSTSLPVRVISTGVSSSVPTSCESATGGSLTAATVMVTCNPQIASPVSVDVTIKTVVGPEVITGSTRMKAGTATKMVLNMITTTAMIKMGKVFGNYMIDHQAINSKLVDRGTRIISILTGLSYDEAYQALLAADKHVKEAVVMVKMNVSLEQARKLIAEHDGFIRFAFEQSQ